MAKKSGPKPGKQVEALRHQEDKRRNIPTAEHQSVIEKTEEAPKEIRYNRSTDLDPQFMWRGKDYQDWSALVVQAPPLYIQEKIQPKALIDDLMRQSKASAAQQSESQFDLFADFNGVPEGAEKTEFYRHDQNWSNRMILGDSLQVMASLAEREGLRGKVQCIYFDPPYGIKFNSNFQWSTTSRDVKDGNAAHITREPEQVKAFRDTWRDGIHSYLTYLRDRLVVARDLLGESGAIFVQIGDENVHRVRALLDEVMGESNFITQIFCRTTAVSGSEFLGGTGNYVLFYAKSKGHMKYRPLFTDSGLEQDVGNRFTRVQTSNYERRTMNSAEREGNQAALALVRPYRHGPLTSQSGGQTTRFEYRFEGVTFRLRKGFWKTNQTGMDRLMRAARLGYPTHESLASVRFIDDFPVTPLSEVWQAQSGAFTDEKIYVVQTNKSVIERCLLMCSDPGDLVLDPTCGSGTTAYVAEEWGRRWITIDTSRVALTLARARMMGARYPFYVLADSIDGQRKEAEVSGRTYSDKTAYGNVRHGFTYQRVPHVTLKSITNNVEIDVLWGKWQPVVENALFDLNAALRGHAVPFRVMVGGRDDNDVRFDAPNGSTVTMPSGEAVPAFELTEWEVPRRAPEDWPAKTGRFLDTFWEARTARQKEIDASITAKAEVEYLRDRPYEDKTKVRVVGPFTVESLSPHRTLGVSADDELLDTSVGPQGGPHNGQTFEQMVLDNLKAAGVQQAHKADRIAFTSVTPWPGELVCGEGRYRESDIERRAGIFIGPEFGTVGRADLVKAAREAGDAGFDVLIACAFNYEAHAAEFSKLGRIPVLKARMNADLHMAGDLKATSTANLFVIFGEPDIEIHHESDGRIFVEVKGVDVFDPSTGEVRSDGPDGIACWFIDTDYNEESFFVRHAYFLGQNDPYSALRTTLKAEINADAWATLHSATSRPFQKPTSGRIAVKVINHLGDEVMKVFRVE